MHLQTAQEIHAANVMVGWWPEDPSQRNRGEVMMLIVSEVGEASEGELSNLMDDKLPQHPMFQVEIADTAIRLYDLIGADAMQVAPDMEARVEQLFDEMHAMDAQVDLMLIVRCVSKAMEHHRKGRLALYGHMLWQALAACYAIADTYGFNLDAIIAEKRAFNAVRPDHKLENRQKEGGKRY